MPAYNPDDYEPVEDRIRAFWADHPDGKILTHIEYQDVDRCVFGATIYRDNEHIVSSGYAEELRGSGPINRTNHVENCETSAIGRALANAGYATKGKRPSREEMQKADRGTTTGPTAARNDLRQYAEENKLDLGKVAAKYQEMHGKPLAKEINVELIRGFLELVKGADPAEFKEAK